VTIQDASGNTVTNATGGVTVTLGANPRAGTLSGITTVNPVNGVATFSGLSINRAGSGYTLVASSTPLTGATSAAFTISPGTATQLAFTAQPNNGTAGVALAPAIAVTVQDAFGNTVQSATSSVALAIGMNPAAGTLSGTPTVSVVNGVASFTDLAIDKAGSGYTLLASSNSLTSATSTAFNIGAGPVASVWMNPGAAVLNFVAGPDSILLHATPLDAGGNSVQTTVTWGSSDPVTATVDPTGLVVGQGVGVATITASAGGKAGTATIGVECTLRCDTPSVWFSQQPTSALAADTIAPAVQVSIGCAFGCGSTWSGVVSIAIGYNPGGGTLTGNTDVFVSYPDNLQATWSNLRIDKPGTGYTLVAIVKSSLVVGVASSSFNITP
jgi:hypothetical protein